MFFFQPVQSSEWFITSTEISHYEQTNEQKHMPFRTSYLGNTKMELFHALEESIQYKQIETAYIRSFECLASERLS